MNHKNGVKTDNRVANLEYITNSANIHHARATGLLSVKGEKNNKAKLTESCIQAIRDAYSRGQTQAEIAAKYGVDQTNISRVVRRDTWRHVI